MRAQLHRDQTHHMHHHVAILAQAHSLSFCWVGKFLQCCWHGWFSCREQFKHSRRQRQHVQVRGSCSFRGGWMFDCKIDMSLDFDDKNNWVRVGNVAENSLSGKKNQTIRGIPELCEQDLRPGDFVEIVNGKTCHAEIQHELRCALFGTWRAIAPVLQPWCCEPEHLLGKVLACWLAWR